MGIVRHSACVQFKVHAYCSFEVCTNQNCNNRKEKVQVCINSLLVVLEHERCSQINLSPNNLTLLKDKLPGSLKLIAMLTRRERLASSTQ